MQVQRIRYDGSGKGDTKGTQFVSRLELSCTCRAAAPINKFCAASFRHNPKANPATRHCVRGAVHREPIIPENLNRRSIQPIDQMESRPTMSCVPFLSRRATKTDDREFPSRPSVSLAQK